MPSLNFFLMFSARDGIQDFMHAKQVLYASSFHPKVTALKFLPPLLKLFCGSSSIRKHLWIFEGAHRALLVSFCLSYLHTPTVKLYTPPTLTLLRLIFVLLITQSLLCGIPLPSFVLLGSSFFRCLLLQEAP
jgi:hypothetical protein